MPKDSPLLSLKERLRIAVASIFSIIHDSVAKAAKQMQLQMKRHSYVTPTNYLELVAGYKEYEVKLHFLVSLNSFCRIIIQIIQLLLFDRMIAIKRKELFNQANKLSNGLGKIDEARSSVEIMTVDLEKAQVKGKTNDIKF